MLTRKKNRNGAEILPLTPQADEPEQVARVISLAWGKGEDAERLRSMAQKLRQEVQEAVAEERCVFKAVRAQRIVGFARIRREPGDSTVWWFSGVCVEPLHQRRGVGTALFVACAAYAERWGASVIRSEAHSDNVVSIGFHRELGFHEDGEFTAPDGDRKVGFSMVLVAGAGDEEVR